MKVNVESGTDCLAVSRATAHKQISALIAEGRVLLALQIESAEALRSAEKREREWIAYAIGFFKQMFENDLHARQYIKFQSRVFGSLSFQQRLSYFEYRVQECIDQLESDLRRLPLIPESELTSKYPAVHEYSSDELRVPAPSKIKFLFAFGVAAIALLFLIANSDLHVFNFERRAPAFFLALLSSGLVWLVFVLLRIKGMPSVRRASLLGVFAFVFFLDPIGRWMPLPDQLAQYYLEEDLDSIGGTGWIWVGNYNMASYRWTSGPFYQLARLDRDGNHNFPWAGDTIRLNTARQIVILDWQATKVQRSLDSPSGKTGIQAGDFTPIRLPAGAILEVADVQWSPTKENSVVVWARVTAPQARN